MWNFNLIPCFRLTIRNVNELKFEINTFEYEGFRLTIRNVNTFEPKLYTFPYRVLD